MTRINTTPLSDALAQVRKADAALEAVPANSAADALRLAKLQEATDHLSTAVHDLLLWAGQVNDHLASTGATLVDDTHPLD